MTKLGFQDAWLMSAIGFMIFINVLGATFTWAKALNKRLKVHADKSTGLRPVAEISPNLGAIRGSVAIIGVATILNVLILLLNLFRLVR